MPRLLDYQQAIARDIARTRIAHPPAGRALSPSPCSHGGSRVRVGSARRYALCRHERVRDAHTTREPSRSRHGAYISTRFFLADTFCGIRLCLWFIMRGWDLSFMVRV